MRLLVVRNEMRGFRILHPFPGGAIGRVDDLCLAAERAMGVNRLQQVDPPIEEDNLAPALDPELRLDLQRIARSFGAVMDDADLIAVRGAVLSG
jgi:hypothetical protein